MIDEVLKYLKTQHLRKKTYHVALNGFIAQRTHVGLNLNWQWPELLGKQKY